MKVKLLKFLPLMAFSAGLLLSEVYPKNPPEVAKSHQPILKIKALIKTNPSSTKLIGVYNPSFTKKLLTGYLISSAPIDHSEMEVASIIATSPVSGSLLSSNTTLIISPLILDKDLKKNRVNYEINY